MSECVLCGCSVFAGCQIPYPKREFLNEDEPEEKADKVMGCSTCSHWIGFDVFLKSTGLSRRGSVFCPPLLLIRNQTITWTKPSSNQTIKLFEGLTTILHNYINSS